MENIIASAVSQVDDAGRENAPRRSPPGSFVIFGGGGDLTHRLLLPAIYNLACADLLDDGFSVIAVDRADLTDAQLRQNMHAALEDFVARRGAEAVALRNDVWTWLEPRISYVRGDFETEQTYQDIAVAIGERNCIFYLAVAARFFGPIVDRLGEAGLVTEGRNTFRRVVVEKPFGHDLPSAIALNTRLLNTLDEQQIYRIDHYLGKETVQNILALRFSNGFFEPLWNRQNIDHVQITAAETVGVEQRAKFYEGTGAVRDMVPNHVMQLLAMTAMEAPISFDADAVRNEKTKVLDAIHTLAPGDVVRGQYAAGVVGGKDVPGYRQEPGVDPHSLTETYAAMKFQIDNWRWAGVPFYVRTGKRLAARKTEIAIHFKSAPYALFRDTPVESLTPNIMVIHIQPTEGVTLQFSAKIPGPAVRLGGVRMKFDYAEWFSEGPSTGYETLIYDCMIGDATLFQRADNIEAGWRAVQPILDWGQDGRTLAPYAAGSEGPAAADALLARDNRHWLKIG
ncbi:glucose-6-phosphate dehydrogenase [Komagataeibacter saccharivorans]|uniref:glucose-6-phosphate dehydrogenase n=1 Tax=Komagataeibacter saccharivorans TaxID=265959 RepID=UPI000D7CFBAF|nr:glucose-6-phosphate dehydrogenase [Komagataeibacter saccharivorans]PYD50730.1 glucose-6-phosphate dehydrogenase [Komagataeibacter saccharivorans]GBQ34094.1 glucose-6-phosphate 1-dehydrogenase [Komagataeibacter saccharivorans NRIC 0614]